MPPVLRGIASTVKRHDLACFTDETRKLRGTSHLLGLPSGRVGNSRPALCDGDGAEDAEWQGRVLWPQSASRRA